MRKYLVALLAAFCVLLPVGTAQASITNHYTENDCYQNVVQQKISRVYWDYDSLNNTDSPTGIRVSSNVPGATWIVRNVTLQLKDGSGHLLFTWFWKDYPNTGLGFFLGIGADRRYIVSRTLNPYMHVILNNGSSNCITNVTAY